MQQVRHFFKPHSVFARWMMDTKQIINKCFESDK